MGQGKIVVRKFTKSSAISFLFSAIFVFGALFVINGCGIQAAGYLGFDGGGSDPELGGVYGPSQTNQPVAGDHPDAGGVIGDDPIEPVPEEPPPAPRRISFADAQIYSAPRLDPGG
jgi:hypothetical protein